MFTKAVTNYAPETSVGSWVWLGEISHSSHEWWGQKVWLMSPTFSHRHWTDTSSWRDFTEIQMVLVEGMGALSTYTKVSPFPLLEAPSGHPAQLHLGPPQIYAKMNQLSLKSFIWEGVSLFLLQVEESYKSKGTTGDWTVTAYIEIWHLSLLNYIQSLTDDFNILNITVNWRKLPYLCGQHKCWLSFFPPIFLISVFSQSVNSNSWIIYCISRKPAIVAFYCIHYKMVDGEFYWRAKGCGKKSSFSLIPAWSLPRQEMEIWALFVDSFNCMSRTMWSVSAVCTVPMKICNIYCCKKCRDYLNNYQ